MLSNLKKTKETYWKFILNIVTIFLLSVAIIWSFTGEDASFNLFNTKNSTWTEGWTQIVDGEEIALDTSSDFESVEIGDTLILTNVLPELVSDQVLFFYSKDLEINVYADDTLIYSFEMQEKFEFLQSPGHLWNEVVIPVELSGATIRMEFTSQFSNRFMGTVTNIYLLNECEVMDKLFNEEGFRFLMAGLTLLMTIIAYVNTLIWKRKAIKSYFFALGHFYLSIMLWLCGISGVFNYIWNQPVANMVICNLMILILPITVYGLYKVIYNGKLIFLHIAGIAVWGNFFLQFILQFIFGISILTLLPLSFVIYIIGSICIVALTLHHIYHRIRNNQDFHDGDFALVSTIIFFLGAVVEIIILCLFPKRTDLIGLSGITGACIYMIVNVIALTRFESNTDVEKIQIEEDYNQLQNVALVQQIKAHFFFNTLNNISGLCKHDAKEADRAIKLFAHYMHSYMHIINVKKNIPLLQEIELIKSSLEIEELRFPNTFNYQFDLEYDNFKIPPLTLQPIVENAMYHGLRKGTEYGELIISTKRIHDTAVIIISDNGVGFDPSILDKTESVGLNNLKKRLKIMANGSLFIKSKKGEGTTVIIEIPITTNLH